MEIVHEQAFSLDFWHLYICLSQNPEEQRQNWNTFIWIFQTLQWGYFQKLRKGHGDSFFPCFFFYENLPLSKFIIKKKYAVSKCALFVECQCKNFLVYWGQNPMLVPLLTDEEVEARGLSHLPATGSLSPWQCSTGMVQYVMCCVCLIGWDDSQHTWVSLNTLSTGRFLQKLMPVADNLFCKWILKGLLSITFG